MSLSRDGYPTTSNCPTRLLESPHDQSITAQDADVQVLNPNMTRLAWIFPLSAKIRIESGRVHI
jgi:hypothetical protein